MMFLYMRDKSYEHLCWGIAPSDSSSNVVILIVWFHEIIDGRMDCVQVNIFNPYPANVENMVSS